MPADVKDFHFYQSGLIFGDLFSYFFICALPTVHLFREKTLSLPFIHSIIYYSLEKRYLVQQAIRIHHLIFAG